MSTIGSDVVIGLVLMPNDLNKITCRIQRIIKQNITFSPLVKAVFLTFTIDVWLYYGWLLQLIWALLWLLFLMA